VILSGGFVMREFTRTVEKEQTVYEITKEELEDIKREARNKGRYDVIEYVRFAWNNFYLELNLAGRQNFLIDMFNCIVNEEGIIKNMYNLSFKDYVKKYRSE
jgi:hypothetical protein